MLTTKSCFTFISSLLFLCRSWWAFVDKDFFDRENTIAVGIDFEVVDDLGNDGLADREFAVTVAVGRLEKLRAVSRGEDHHHLLLRDKAVAILIDLPKDINHVADVLVDIEKSIFVVISLGKRLTHRVLRGLLAAALTSNTLVLIAASAASFIRRTFMSASLIAVHAILGARR